MRYRPEIDGLRAVAVVPVILFHAGFELFGGGYVGVDVFFVISGYLITGILLREAEGGGISLLHFYERRARRILPALFLVMLACIPFAWLWLMPPDLKDFAQSVAAVSTFSSNFLFWSESGYFQGAVEMKPLIHTWSLAVEEQFYILYPLLLIAVWPLGRRRVVALLAALFVLSLAGAHVYSTTREGAAAFYLLPARGWEILAGALAAFYLRGRPAVRAPGRLHQIASLLGLALIAFAVFLFDRFTPFPSLYTLAPVLGATLLILFAVEGTVAHALLSHRAPVLIGLISYSAYLWHQPLLAFARHRSEGEPDAWLMGALGLASFPLAYLSWRFVEQPFRNRAFLDRPLIFRTSAAFAGVFIGLGFFGHAANGFESRPINHQFRVLDYEPDNDLLQQRSWTHLRELSGKTDYLVARDPFERTLWFEPADPRAKLLVVGNSHSKDLYNLLLNSRTAAGRLQVARAGIPVNALSEELFDLPNYTHADIVMIASRYEEKDFNGIESVIERILADGKRPVFVKKLFEFYHAGNNTLADLLIREAVRDETPIDDALVYSINATHFAQYRNVQARERPADAFDANDEIDRLARAYPEIVVLDRMDYACDAERAVCFAVDERLNKHFYDYGHQTLKGARFFGARVDAIGWLEPLWRGDESGGTALPAEVARASSP